MTTFMLLTTSRNPHQSETGFDQLNQSMFMLSSRPVVFLSKFYLEVRPVQAERASTSDCGSGRSISSTITTASVKACGAFAPDCACCRPPMSRCECLPDIWWGLEVVWPNRADSPFYTLELWPSPSKRGGETGEA